MTDYEAGFSLLRSAPESETARADRGCDLAAAFRRGECEATSQLIAQATPRVTRLVRRLLAWTEDVDDVVHDVFVAALVARKSFRGDAAFETWITRIAVNRCRAHNRRKWVRDKLLAAWRDRQPTTSGTADPLAVEEQSAAVRRVVAGLPPLYREVVVLYYLESMTVADVAQTLGIKTNTVDKRLSRARAKLTVELSRVAK